MVEEVQFAVKPEAWGYFPEVWEAVAEAGSEGQEVGLPFIAIERAQQIAKVSQEEWPLMSLRTVFFRQLFRRASAC